MTSATLIVMMMKPLQLHMPACIRSAIHALVFAAVLLLLTSCASVPTQPSAADGPPIDFSLSVMVVQPTGQMSGRDQQSVDDDQATTEPVLASILPDGRGQFVLSPDGLLRFGQVAAPNADWSPIAVRQLDRRAMQQVWSMVWHMGFATADATDHHNGDVASFEMQSEREPAAYSTFTFTGWDARWQFARSVDSSDVAQRIAAVELIATLAELAWLDAGPQTYIISPRRYDFGPDPYAQYR